MSAFYRVTVKAAGLPDFVGSIWAGSEAEASTRFFALCYPHKDALNGKPVEVSIVLDDPMARHYREIAEREPGFLAWVVTRKEMADLRDCPDIVLPDDSKVTPGWIYDEAGSGTGANVDSGAGDRRTTYPLSAGLILSAFRHYAHANIVLRCVSTGKTDASLRSCG